MKGTGPIPAAAGIGLRFCHHRAVLAEKPAVGWMEVHSENYMSGGEPIAFLQAIRRDYPISLHGVGLSLGSVDGIDAAHLDRLADLTLRIEPGLVSDHLSFSVARGVYLADLLPLPMTEEALQTVCRNVDCVQDRLKRPILVENPSSYLRYRHSVIPEAEFLAAVAARTGCGILLDINNVYVSACNHGWDASAYLSAIPTGVVGEIHLAGHSLREVDGRTIRVDDHGSPVAEAVWTLFAEALPRFGRLPVLLERDNHIPSLADLVTEAGRAQSVLDLNGVAHADAA
jgi:uncharacterized protein (UPF0276 family)